MIVVPFCGIAAVDRLHMTVDEMHILDVKENLALATARTRLLVIFTF